jgi:hypothetical protein
MLLWGMVQDAAVDMELGQAMKRWFKLKRVHTRREEKRLK